MAVQDRRLEEVAVALQGRPEAVAVAVALQGRPEAMAVALQGRLEAVAVQDRRLEELAVAVQDRRLEEVAVQRRRLDLSIPRSIRRR